MRTHKVSPAVLREYVIQSNLIEGIRVKPGHPLFDNHIKAAWFVLEHATGRRFIHPNEIHRILMRDSGILPGCYRRGKVVIVTRGRGSLTSSRIVRMPRRRYVNGLMKKWEKAWREILSIPAPLPHQKLSLYLYWLHHTLLSIHPYEDGNGRTARLFWNALRLQLGFPWQIIYANRRSFYYHNIRRFQKEEFEPAHADTY